MKMTTRANLFLTYMSLQLMLSILDLLTQGHSTHQKKKECNHFKENLEVHDMQFVQIAKALYQNAILTN